MANIFITLPSQAANGSGAATDVSAMGATKTFTVAGTWPPTMAPTITVEVNNDATPTDSSWAPVCSFLGEGERTLDIAARWMRATVSGYRQGTAPDVEIGSTNEGTSFVELVATVGDGEGAGVDTSALGLFKTAHVGGAFRGSVQIEISEDGGATYAQIASFQAGGVQSRVVAADFMRASRSGVPLVAPGLPIINVGACDVGGGGGSPTPELIGTPVITARQWTTALAPLGNGEWNFITQSYNYPDDEPTEWVVVNLQAGTYETYAGPNGIYSNTNFQIPSVGTSVTINNQLRAPDGKIYFLSNIGPPTVYLAYYDPADEQVKQITADVSPPNTSFCYSGIFNHDGSKLYMGTQCEGFTQPSVFEVDTTTHALTLIGSGGSLTPGFPNYAYTLAKDEGPGADWIYFARGQSEWELVALEISTGIATVLFATSGPGFQYVQVYGDATSCRAVIYDNGVPTNYYIFDGALSLLAPGVPRDCTPYDGSLVNPPEIDWTHGIGQVLYRDQPYYDVQTPTTAEWTAVLAAAGVAKPAPSSIWQMQDAGPNLADTGGAGRTFVGSGTGLTYENITTNWGDRRSVRFTEAASNKLVATIPNVNANSLLVLMYVQQYVQPIDLRSVIESDAGYAMITAVPRYYAVGNVGTSGVENPGTTWHPVWLRYDRTALAFQVITDQEAITDAYFGGGVGTNLVLGGSAGTTSPPARMIYGAAWSGAAAEWSTAQIQAVNDALNWDDPFVTPTWVQRDYTVANTRAIELESLVVLPASKEPLTNAEQYCGFATRLDWHGAWNGGPSQPKTLVIGDYVYLCGYPDGVLYRYTEAEPWAPDGADTGNPALLGAYSSGADLGMKYPYFIRYNSLENRIYCNGRRERDHDGCSLGWYDRAAETFSTPMNDAPLDEFRAPAGLAVIESLGLIVFSGTLFPDSALTTAPLVVYDADLVYVAQWDIAPGLTTGGNIYATSTPEIVMGIDENAVMYRINVVTGVVVQTEPFGTLNLGPAQQLDSATLLITVDDNLCTVNLNTLVVTVIQPIGFTPNYLARSILGELFMTLGAELYSLDPP